jgi:branched-chain amino acid transport system permease protein
VAAGAVCGAAYGLCWNIAFQGLRGASLALATLAAAEIPKILIDNWEGFTFGSLGITGLTPLPSLSWGRITIDWGREPRAQYFLMLTLLIGFGWVHRQAMNSRWGWAVRAVREDEQAAASLGIDVTLVRSWALLISALLTGVCGAMYAHLIGLVEPPLVFNLHLSALPLILSIFGGRYFACGPALGALILYPLDQVLFHSWLPRGHAGLYGLVLILTVLISPQGIAKWLRKPHPSA